MVRRRRRTAGSRRPSFSRDVFAQRMTPAAHRLGAKASNEAKDAKAAAAGHRLVREGGRAEVFPRPPSIGRHLRGRRRSEAGHGKVPRVADQGAHKPEIRSGAIGSGS